ncbi:MAG: ParA family protein [Candidatus Krumholzibacteria bacterium]|nr:ParA family protein [Candidatus Krumholzibacteria bacterium]MDH4335702.1 ParA family protein [Candidatus Krumholzibacteria bacterium]MDH5270047.1 ParA family protein [Candidatus Krumholzibacteria bacterium]MDH5627768.1 ParA family protein [Candidatus Krumholzibacteria bacterium]
MDHTTVAAFLNQKGGVGKTTTVANVGAGLAILGSRVLLVDLDPQGHLTRFLGIDRDEIHHTIHDVLRGDINAAAAIMSKPLNARLHMENRVDTMSMSLIPASLDFADAEVALVRASDRDYLLKRAITNMDREYDYILFDCSPSLGLITTNALVAASTAFIPVQTEYLAMESIEDLLKWIESVRARFNPTLEVGGMIATRFDGRKVLSRMVVETLRERYGALLLDAIIRDNIALAESPRYGKDIFSYRPRSFGADDYLGLCNEIMDRVSAPSEDDSLDLDELESYVSEPFRPTGADY